MNTKKVVLVIAMMAIWLIADPRMIEPEMKIVAHNTYKETIPMMNRSVFL